MWLYLPETISHSLQAWEDLTLQSESLSLTLAASASSRTKSMPQRYWQRELKKGVLMTALSGLTFEHSQATSSVEKWLASLAVSPAPTYPSPDDKRESTVSTQDSGLSTSASFAKCSPGGSLSKTFPQSSLFPQAELYLVGLPKAGSMRNGYLFERPMWEPPTAAKGSSYWPTSRQEDAESCGNHPGATDSLTGATRNWYTPHGMNGTDHTGKQGRGGEFAKQVTQWPTPKTSDDISAGNEVNAQAGKGGNNLLGAANLWQTPATDSFRSRGGDRKDEMGLDQQSRGWPTPNAASHSANTNRGERGSGGPNLHETAHQWPTPTTWEQSENPESFEDRRLRELAKGRNGNGMGMPLDMKATSWGTPTSRDWKDGSSRDADCPTNGLLGRQVIRDWPTPQARDYRSVTGRESEQRDNAMQNLNIAADFHSSPQAPEPLNSGGASLPPARTLLPPSQRKRLNVLFVTWMMGWPLSWLAPVQTASAPAEMELWLRRQRLLLRSLLGD